MTTDREEATPNESQEQLPVKEAVQGEPEGAETTEVKGEEATTPKQFSVEEHKAALKTERGKYAGLDKRFTQVQEESKGLNAQLAKALERIDEAEANRFVQRVEDEGGDVNVAKMIVAEKQAAAKATREAQVLQAEITKQQGILNEAAKGKQAYDLIKEHQLDADTLDDLLKSENPTEMENKALRLRLEKSKTEQRPPDKTPTVPGSTKGVQWDKLPLNERMGRAMEEKV